MEISKVYFHVHNGGVIIAFNDSQGPQISINSSFFGNSDMTFKVNTNKDSLIKLREALDKAIEYDEYTEEYCYSAKI